MVALVVVYAIAFAILLVVELGYFKLAELCGVIDKPNERSSHSTVVLRGGGILFTAAMCIWAVYYATCGSDLEGDGGTWSGLGLVFRTMPFLIGLLMVSAISFVDDMVGTSNKLRLFVQFMGAASLLCGLLTSCDPWMILWGWHDVFICDPLGVTLFAIVATIACVGIMNVYNFMDGINGITGGYSLSVLVSLLILNEYVFEREFITNSLLVFEIIAVLIFCYFNFRPKGKAKCFAGDVGSVSMAFILLYFVARLMACTWDLTWIVFFVVYGVDGCLTIVHRIMLHERLGQAHRKHAYQIMANELKINPVIISCGYMILQLIIDLLMIFVVPEDMHTLYLVGTIVVLSIAYILFMKKYYHLHAEYLASLQKKE